MNILGFYFTGEGGWIEYSENGQVIKQTFESAESLHDFIINNNIPLSYSGCLNCSN